DGPGEAAALFRRLQVAGYPVGDGIDAPVGSDASDPDVPMSVQSFQRRVLGTEAISVAADAARPGETPERHDQSSQATASPEIAGRLMWLARILAAVAIGIGAVAVLSRPRSTERSTRRAAERHLQDLINGAAARRSGPGSGPEPNRLVATVQVR